MRNFETAIGQRDDWTRTNTTAKLPTTEATDTSQAATLNQFAPRISSHGLFDIPQWIVYSCLAYSRDENNGLTWKHPAVECNEPRDERTLGCHKKREKATLDLKEFAKGFDRRLQRPVDFLGDCEC